jgi:5-methylcytosine-specific restriction endonuclease McrA
MKVLGELFEPIWKIKLFNEDNLLKRNPLSRETKNKISNKLKGHRLWGGEFKIGHKHSESTKRKISFAGMGRPTSSLQKETARRNFLERNPMKDSNNREKVRLFNLGKKHSPQTIEKIRVSSKARNLRGAKHPNWKGGLDPLTIRIRHSFQYRLWRSDVYKRDVWTCQKCGIKGCNIEAHHIKSFKYILESNHINSFEMAMNCAELWDINNGITLCECCHDSA